MPNTRGHKVIIRDKSLVNAINRTLKGTGVEPEQVIETMAPLIVAFCEHAMTGFSIQGSPQAIKSAVVLKEIYSLSLEFANKIKPKEINTNG